MANSKKLILFVVEGRSDRAYLYPIKKMVKSCSNNKVEFKITKGDILVQSDTNYSNIETKVKETVQEYLKLYGLQYSDIKQIVHVVDLDGSFINAEKIITDSTLPRGQTMYFRDKITNVDRNNIIRRNKKKTECLNVLYNMNKISFETNASIPYRIYYFSTNIDDYFFDKQNLTDEDKIAYSNLISDRYLDDAEEYRRRLEEDFCAPGNYIETWQYAKVDTNSLSRCTNFNKFFTEILDRL